ncbi:hypothetical protein ABE073_04195 [Lederbergia citrisecunda]|uniref:hypothetical protein n=1 Tax=Lederbergia citrisecunda TaxID=2833583 RepID=UPI003D27864E
MTYEELSGLLKYYHKESNLFMPNEIFNDLKSHIKTKTHIAFAYSYIYFITWLYRYAKHVNLTVTMDNKQIKEILGYKATNQTLDYLIKRRGLLDKNEYTETTRDYPINWDYSSSEDELSFMMFSSLNDNESQYIKTFDKRFFLKKPITAFNRIVKEAEEEIEVEGTFFDVSNTHNIPFEVFLFCMSNEKIGVTGFYLYSYLKHKNDLFEGGYDVSLTHLAEETGISLRSLNTYLGYLRRYKLVDCIHNMEFYVIDMPKEDRKANTYITRDFYLFSDEAIPYRKIGVKSLDDYNKHIEERDSLVQRVENEMPF